MISIIIMVVVSACDVIIEISQSDDEAGIVLVETATVIPLATPSLTLTPFPTSTPYVAPPSCTLRTDWHVYVIQRGDTVFNIAQRANSNVNTIASANCINDPSNISVGQTLYVPIQIQAKETLQYWMPTDVLTSEPVLVGCDSLVTLVDSTTSVSNDAATNIRNRLNFMFNNNAPLNYWAGQGLSVQSVTIDANNRAHIVVSGNLTLVGTCADGLMKAQFLLNIFAEESVQSAYVTVGGRNLVQIFDMSGLQPENAVFTPFDIGYAQ